MTAQPAKTVKPDAEAMLRLAEERLAAVRGFMARQMEPGVDYESRPGKRPVLKRRGAQRLMAGFGLASRLVDIRRNWDLRNDLVAYEVTVQITNKATGTVEAEAAGESNSREERFADYAATEVANAVLRRAQNLATIEAVANATGAIAVFDTEELILEPGESAQEGRQRPQRPVRDYLHPETVKRTARGQRTASERLFDDARRYGWGLDSEGSFQTQVLWEVLRRYSFKDQAITEDNLDLAYEILGLHYSELSPGTTRKEGG